MATFLDVTGLSYFSNLFSFLFVWIIIYALLKWKKFLGDNDLLNALIGLIFGVFTIVNPTITEIIVFIAPWIALVFIFILFIEVAGGMTGGIGLGDSAAKTIFFTLLIVIVIIGILIYARDKMDVPDEITEDSDMSKLNNVLFHPKFIGMVFILIVAVFTVALLTSRSM